MNHYIRNATKMVTVSVFKAQIALFLVLCACNVSAADKGRYESLPSYTVEKRSIDNSILPGRAKIYFTFRNPSGSLLKKSTLTLHHTGKAHTLTTDTLGNAVFAISAGKYKFYLYGYNYREIVTDSIEFASQEKIEIRVNFESDYEIHPVRKPVIYLYPTLTTDVNVTLNIKGDLFFSYPAYNNGWNVTANPDGTLQSNGKTFNYLFWEANTTQVVPVNTQNQGCVVSSDTLLHFLENSLTAMGLSTSEQQDFITYWYPQMATNKTNLVRFVFNADCDLYADLDINPAPNHIYRVYMLWSDANGHVFPNLIKQTFPVLKREGFTVVEWGGVELKPSDLGYSGN